MQSILFRLAYLCVPAIGLISPIYAADNAPQPAVAATKNVAILGDSTSTKQPVAKTCVNNTVATGVRSRACVVRHLVAKACVNNTVATPSPIQPANVKTIPIFLDPKKTVVMEMVDIPTGGFWMGACKSIQLSPAQAKEDAKNRFLGKSVESPQTPDCAENNGVKTGMRRDDPRQEEMESPQHLVQIKAFQMSQTEVTVGQFSAYLKERNSKGKATLELMTEKENAFIRANQHEGAVNYPVINVSLQDALDFIVWLNEKTGKKDAYRLPSEAEWEYACRGGGYQTYCGSNYAEEVAWVKYDEKDDEPKDALGMRRVMPVKGKKPNGYGLYDMSGNAAEWVADAYYDKDGKEGYERALIDGSALPDKHAKFGILRGGSIYHTVRYARATRRQNSLRTYKGPNSGFRVVKNVTE